MVCVILFFEQFIWSRSVQVLSPWTYQFRDYLGYFSSFFWFNKSPYLEFNSTPYLKLFSFTALSILIFCSFTILALPPFQSVYSRQYKIKPVGSYFLYFEFQTTSLFLILVLLHPSLTTNLIVFHSSYQHRTCLSLLSTYTINN